VIGRENEVADFRTKKVNTERRSEKIVPTKSMLLGKPVIRGVKTNIHENYRNKKIRRKAKKNLKWVLKNARKHGKKASLCKKNTK